VPRLREHSGAGSGMRLRESPRRLSPSGEVRTLDDVSDNPSRIELLELDIDLRLADLWREAVDVTDWTLAVVAAFIRAAYGKGYCDALTEESPGALCVDHGYRMPDRRVHERDAA
jgi:hypothetical protein